MRLVETFKFREDIDTLPGGWEGIKRYPYEYEYFWFCEKAISELFPQITEDKEIVVEFSNEELEGFTKGFIKQSDVSCQIGVDKEFYVDGELIDLMVGVLNLEEDIDDDVSIWNFWFRIVETK